MNRTKIKPSFSLILLKKQKSVKVHYTIGLLSFAFPLAMKNTNDFQIMIRKAGSEDNREATNAIPIFHFLSAT